MLLSENRERLGYVKTCLERPSHWSLCSPHCVPSRLAMFTPPADEGFKTGHFTGTDYILFVLALVTIIELIIELIYFPGKSKEE